MSKQMVVVGVGVLGVFVGSAVGYVASETLQEPQEVVTQTQVVQEELSNEDLEELCKGLTDEEKKNVLEVQEEVKLLQMTLADREAELEKLKEQKYTAQKRLEKQLVQSGKQWKKRLLRCKFNLPLAEQERDELKVEITRDIGGVEKNRSKNSEVQSQGQKV